MSRFLKFLENRGCKNIVICPGGRNKTLIDLVYSDDQFEIQSFYDERSAAFYALGLSQSHPESPVALIVTSGSAVGECLPAVIEGHYQKKAPLIIVSADRPLELRSSGAPQTMPQLQVFEDFAHSIYDISEIEDFDYESIEDKYPLHMNVCLPDPNKSEIQKERLNLDSLLIFGSLEKEDHEKVKGQFKNYSGFVVLESLSNLDSKSFPKAKVVSCPDQVFKLVDIKSFAKIMRVGGIPITRAWRDLDDTEVWFWDEYPYAGTMYGQGCSLEKLASVSSSLGEEGGRFSQICDEVKKKLMFALDSFPVSEVGVLNDTQTKIPSGSFVFLGNSLPVREWELLTSRPDLTLCGQRGINGIDGTVSYALGRANKQFKEVWIVLGDLTALYDFNGLWTLRYLKEIRVRILVVNNFGGRIFHKIFQDVKLTNAHEHDFSSFAEQWELDYSRTLNDSLGNHALIELQPDLSQSDSFWNEFE